MGLGVGEKDEKRRVGFCCLFLDSNDIIRESGKDCFEDFWEEGEDLFLAPWGGEKEGGRDEKRQEIYKDKERKGKQKNK